jgi:hypothetical protein
MAHLVILQRRQATSPSQLELMFASLNTGFRYFHTVSMIVGLGFVTLPPAPAKWL